MSSSDSNSTDDLTKDQITDLRNAFDEFDTDKEGVISSENLFGVMKHLGQNPSDEDVSKMIQNADQNGNNLIEFNEFIVMMNTYIQENDARNVTKDIFTLFDKNKNGLISSKELSGMMKSMGERLSHKQLTQMMKFADLNRDGAIDFDEFKRLMKEVPEVKTKLERVASNSSI